MRSLYYSSLVVMLAALTVAGSAHANPYTIDPPKGSTDAEFNKDYVRYITRATQEIIGAVANKFGAKPGEKIPVNTWKCVAYTLAANGMEAGRLKAGIKEPTAMESHYRAKQKEHCDDGGDDGQLGVKMFKEAQRLFGQQHHNREALEKLGSSLIAGKLLDTVAKAVGGAVRVGSGAAARASSAILVFIDPTLFTLDTGATKDGT